MAQPVAQNLSKKAVVESTLQDLVIPGTLLTPAGEGTWSYVHSGGYGYVQRAAANAAETFLLDLPTKFFDPKLPSISGLTAPVLDRGQISKVVVHYQLTGANLDNAPTITLQGHNGAGWGKVALATATLALAQIDKGVLTFTPTTPVGRYEVVNGALALNSTDASKTRCLSLLFTNVDYAGGSVLRIHSVVISYVDMA